MHVASKTYFEQPQYSYYNLSSMCTLLFRLDPAFSFFGDCSGIYFFFCDVDALYSVWFAVQ